MSREEIIAKLSAGQSVTLSQEEFQKLKAEVTSEALDQISQYDAEVERLCTHLDVMSAQIDMASDVVADVCQSISNSRLLDAFAHLRQMRLRLKPIRELVIKLVTVPKPCR